MRAMHWSWAEFLDTPPYVLRFVRDCLAMEASSQRQQHEAMQRARNN